MRTAPRVAAALVLVLLAGCREEAPAPPRELTATERDRRELVLQPRRDWVPEDAERRLRVQLIAERTGAALGEPFRYRLEVRNASREPVVFREPAPSFFKDGSLCSTACRFYAAPPGGSERLLPCVRTKGAPAGEALDLTLGSGEYLLTRGEGPGARFRALKTGFRFDKPGRYRIRAECSAMSVNAESNAVEYEAYR